MYGAKKCRKKLLREQRVRFRRLQGGHHSESRLGVGNQKKKIDAAEAIDMKTAPDVVHRCAYTCFETKKLKLCESRGHEVTVAINDAETRPGFDQYDEDGRDQWFAHNQFSAVQIVRSNARRWLNHTSTSTWSMA